MFRIIILSVLFLCGNAFAVFVPSAYSVDSQGPHRIRGLNNLGPTTGTTGVFSGTIKSSNIPAGASVSGVNNGGANPSATATGTAANGVLDTFMRSDAAPAIQTATDSQPGLMSSADHTALTANSATNTTRSFGGLILSPGGVAPVAGYVWHARGSSGQGYWGSIKGDTEIVNTIPVSVGGTNNVNWISPSTGDGLVMYDGTRLTNTLLLKWNPVNGRITTEGNNPAILFRRSGSSKAYIGVAGATDDFITGSVTGDMFLRTEGSSLLFSVNAGSSAAMSISSAGIVAVSTTATLAGLTLTGAVTPSAGNVWHARGSGGQGYWGPVKGATEITGVVPDANLATTLVRYGATQPIPLQDYAVFYCEMRGNSAPLLPNLIDGILPTVTGSPAAASTVTDANSRSSIGKCLTFDGTNDQASYVPSATGPIGSAALSVGSVSVWVKTTAAAQQTIVHDFNGTQGWYLYLSSSGIPGYYFNDGDGGVYTNTIGSTAVNDGLWHNVVWTWGLSSISAYIDGTLSATVSANIAMGSYSMGSTTMYIGSTSTPGNYLVGQLDEVFILNNLRLSDNQVKSLYNYGTVKPADTQVTNFIASNSSSIVLTGAGSPAVTYMTVNGVTMTATKGINMVRSGTITGLSVSYDSTAITLTPVLKAQVRINGTAALTTGNLTITVANDYHPAPVTQAIQTGNAKFVPGDQIQMNIENTAAAGNNITVTNVIINAEVVYN